MNKYISLIFSTIAGISILFATTAFIISDPEADFTKQIVNLDDQISLSDITTKNSDKGAFRSSLNFKQNNFNSSTKEFYGQELIIADNPNLDRIMIGITNNLISRIEIWDKDKIVEIKELGFVGKMTWGDTQTMTVEFLDQTNERYKGKSKISMRFYSGTGILGDIGTINLDLTKYGDFNVDKSIGVFAKSVDSNSVMKPDFSNLQIWKNYKSFD